MTIQVAKYLRFDRGSASAVPAETYTGPQWNPKPFTCEHFEAEGGSNITALSVDLSSSGDELGDWEEKLLERGVRVGSAGDTLEETLRNLTAYSVYAVRMRISTKGGTSEWSVIGRIVTGEHHNKYSDSSYRVLLVLAVCVLCLVLFPASLFAIRSALQSNFSGLHVIRVGDFVRSIGDLVGPAFRQLHLTRLPFSLALIAGAVVLCFSPVYLGGDATPTSCRLRPALLMGGHALMSVVLLEVQAVFSEQAKGVAAASGSEAATRPPRSYGASAALLWFGLNLIVIPVVVAVLDLGVAEKYSQPHYSTHPVPQQRCDNDKHSFTSAGVAFFLTHLCAYAINFALASRSYYGLSGTSATAGAEAMPLEAALGWVRLKYTVIFSALTTANLVVVSFSLTWDVDKVRHRLHVGECTA